MKTTKELAYMSTKELEALCNETEHQETDEGPLCCQYCFILGALSAGIPRAVIAGERRLSEVELGFKADPEDCGYDLNDPKHPTYRERMLDRADIERKRRRENP